MSANLVISLLAFDKLEVNKHIRVNKELGVVVLDHI
jgi:hypothetical protein